MNSGEKRYPPKITLIFRVLVGLYLLYTAWGLKSAPFEHTGVERIIFIIAIIVFLAVGLALSFFSAKALMRGEYDQPEDDEEES